ncbi:MAG TPA: DUF222 domain-containing protein [Pseudonocardiaceae bacterium]|nr:DUF222 domain-containing protein [Pseudonocardiaceae bacterium]
MLSVVAEIDSRGIAAGKGYGSTVELVRAVARIPRSEARSRVDAAADVLPGRGLGGAPIAPRLPHTAAAVAEHAIGATDVAVIRSVLARIPVHIGSAQRAHIEAELAKQARILDAASSPCWVSGCWSNSTRTAGHPPSNRKPGGGCASGTVTVGMS